MEDSGACGNRALRRICAGLAALAMLVIHQTTRGAPDVSIYRRCVSKDSITGGRVGADCGATRGLSSE